MVTIQPNEQGSYEHELPANTVSVFHVPDPSTYTTHGTVQVLVHAADSPVYAMAGKSVEVRHPEADMVTEGNWVELDTGSDRTIAVTCASDAIISVTRR